MLSEAADITFIASECAFALLLLCLCNCHYPNPETTALPARMPATAPVVRLRYFPYSTVGRRASEKLVCPICLDVFEHGETCGEVPACRHFFHQACVDVWRKSSVTCPLCRGYMAATGSSERVSAADDMV